MSTHRQDHPAPRYGRLTLACSAAVVTAVSLLGGLGALPSAADEGPATHGRAGIDLAGARVDQAAPRRAPAVPPTTRMVEAKEEPMGEPASDEALPDDSGSGRRVVFSEGGQRVWLVGRGGGVRRTYPVSGSIYDNLDPGSYEVYSRSERAWGVEDSGSMRWFVRFAEGDTAAIGFHDIPVDDGAPVQTIEQLGSPLSHGCIRQRTADAKALWAFAPLGTPVVVVP